MSLSERMEAFENSDLYVVITGLYCYGRSPLDVLDACLNAGVRLIQFREKEMEDGQCYALGCAFRERTCTEGALLIVDDRVDIALAIGADGVHLGTSDMPLEAARRIAPELIIGASTHNLEEALAAQSAGASYVNIGPIFSTQTKTVPTGTVGPAMIDTITPHLNIPFTCMGGIKESNIDEVLQHGARHIAVVTAVTAAEDVKQAAQQLRDKILRHQTSK